MAWPGREESSRAYSSEAWKSSPCSISSAPLGSHGLVFLPAVAVGDDDDGAQAEEMGGHGNSLTVIAAGGGYECMNVWLSFFEPGRVDQRAAKFEGSDRRVVLMLDPCLGMTVRTEALIEQRPRVLRGGRHGPVNYGLGGFDFLEGGQLHEFSLR